LEKFVEFMADKKDVNKVNLKSLKESLKTIGIRNEGQAYANIRNMPKKVQVALDSISTHLVKEKMQLDEFHNFLDLNKDGVIVMSEWVGQMKQMRVPGINEAELNLIFEHLDVNKDGELSVNEMGLFIKAYELKKEDFRKSLEDDRAFMRDCHEQISELFNLFDENND
jgi:Ca2+-binding EF-hand superfamily protein